MRAHDNDSTRAFARSSFYHLLAKGFSYPTEELLASLQQVTSREEMKDGMLQTVLGAEVQQRLDDVVAVLEQWRTPERRAALETEYNRLFAHLGSAQCPPYETEYGYENVFQKTEAMADIAGFYAAYGLEPASRNTERVDFLSTELEFMAYLTLHESYAREHNEASHLEICWDTQRKFIHDHLGRWATLFTEILSRSTSNGFYRTLGEILSTFLEEEVRLLDVVPTRVTTPNALRSPVPELFGCSACTGQAMFEEVKNSRDHVDG